LWVRIPFQTPKFAQKPKTAEGQKLHKLAAGGRTLTAIPGTMAVHPIGSPAEHDKKMRDRKMKTR
jgi:hypothetical protein